MVYASNNYYRRNRMLENQLLLIIGFEHERVFVETLDPACEFYAAQEIDSDYSLFFARIV